MGLAQQGNWVPQDLMGNRQDTAVLLVGTAKEHGLVVRHHVASTVGGYYISDALADLVYDDEDSTADEEPKDEVSGNETKSTKKTSGNRAGKNSNKE